MRLLPDRAFTFILVFGLLVYLLSLNTFQVGDYMDDANYIVLAESIGRGTGYRQINFPDAPQETRYPFGYPLLLTPLVLAFPHSFVPLQLFSVASTLVSISLFYLLMRKRLRPAYAVLCTAMCALNPAIVGHATLVMSEAVFLAMALLAAYFVEKSAEETSLVSWWFVLGCFVAALSYLVRTIGIVLLFAGLVFYGVRRKFVRATLFGIVFIALAAPWSYRSYSLTGMLVPADYKQQFLRAGPESYTDEQAELSDLIKRPLDNLANYAVETVGDALVPILTGPKVHSLFAQFQLAFIPSAIAVLIFALVVLGWTRSARATLGFLDVFAVFYAAALLLWPFRGTRFLHPLIPLLYYFMLTAIELLEPLLCSRKVRERSRFSMSLLTFCVIVVLLNTGRDIQGMRNPIRTRITDISIGATWISENAPAEAIVMCQDPISRYLYARRFTVWYPSTTDAGQILKQIEQQEADYIIVAPRLQASRTTELDKYTTEYFLPALLARPDKFVQVYRDNERNVSVYRVVDLGSETPQDLS